MMPALVARNRIVAASRPTYSSPMSCSGPRFIVLTTPRIGSPA
jgi:hypothetical protein